MTQAELVVLSSDESAVGCQRSLSWCDVHKATHWFVHKGGLADISSFVEGM